MITVLANLARTGSASSSPRPVRRSGVASIPFSAHQRQSASSAYAAVIAAFAAPENAGKGVIKVDGKMTELLHLDMARRVVAVADAIAAMGS